MEDHQILQIVITKQISTNHPNKPFKIVTMNDKTVVYDCHAVDKEDVINVVKAFLADLVEP